MRIYKLSSIVLFLLSFTFFAAKADEKEYWSECFGGNINGGYSYNLKNHDNAYTVDANYTTVFATGSLGVRFWSKKSNPEYYGAWGFGFFNLAVFQIGYSSVSNLIYRIVSNPIVTTFSYPSSDQGRWFGFRRGLSVNLFFEGTFDRDPKRVVGLSIGLIF
jgi:hypothetical protein